MKKCPTCDKEYEAELVECPDDGALLVSNAPSKKNPTLEEVVQVTATERTAVVDLEKMEAQRLIEKEAERRRLEAFDPEATGTFMAPDPAETASAVTAHSVADELSLKDNDFLYSDMENLPEHQPTELTHRAEEDDTSNTRQETALTQASTDAEDKPKKIALIIAAAALVLVVSASLAFFNSGGTNAFGAPLLVTTTPTNAEVWIDSRRAGETPLQILLAPGFYDVEIKKEGFSPHRDIIELTGKGHTLAKALTPKATTQEGVPTNNADQLADAFYQALQNKNIQNATIHLKTFLRLYPDDKRSSVLIQKLGEETIKQPKKPKKASDNAPASKGPSWEERYASAQEFVRKNQNDQARTTLQRLIAEQPHRPAPHRYLARIAQKINDLNTTRYHLQRYLQLGGADTDGQVKKWLKEHPPK
tara:strand:+ start:792 stop:2048 length:1257 start_codon:yes stop_codon:yes gene_type:complete